MSYKQIKKKLIVTEDTLNMLELIALHWNKSYLFNLKQKRRTTRKTTLKNINQNTKKPKELEDSKESQEKLKTHTQKVNPTQHNPEKTNEMEVDQQNLNPPRLREQSTSKQISYYKFSIIYGSVETSPKFRRKPL